MQKKCCNPFKKKNHYAKAGLRMIDNKTAAKLCRLKKKSDQYKARSEGLPSLLVNTEQKPRTFSITIIQSEQDFTMNEIEPAINISLSSIEASPLIRRQLSNRDKPSNAKSGLGSCSKETL